MRDIAPEIEGWHNYPAREVHNWIISKADLYDDALAILRGTDDIGQAAIDLRDLVIKTLDKDKSSNISAADIVFWCLTYVDWNELAEKLIKEPR